MGELIAAFVLLLAPLPDRCDALAALDVVRTAAWTTGDADLLGGVYDGGSGGADIARLRQWRQRGIVVEGMRTRRSSCRDVGADRVEVVERLGTTVAVLPDGTPRALPQDDWDRRTVTLVRTDGRWRIGAVA